MRTFNGCSWGQPGNWVRSGNYIITSEDMDVGTRNLRVWFPKQVEGERGTGAKSFVAWNITLRYSNIAAGLEPVEKVWFRERCKSLVTNLPRTDQQSMSNSSMWFSPGLMHLFRAEVCWRIHEDMWAYQIKPVRHRELWWSEIRKSEQK